jgi:hypothetical protein
MNGLQRRLAGLMAAAAIVATAVLTGTPAHAAYSFGPYEYSNVAYPLCMDVAYGSQQDGARIQQWWCYNGTPERWTAVYVESVNATDYFELVNQNSPAGHPMCLDLPWGNTTAGVELQLHGCWGGDMQLWAIQTSGADSLRVKSLINAEVNSGWCVQPDPNWPTSPGASMTIQNCTGSTAQQWHLV